MQLEELNHTPPEKVFPIIVPHAAGRWKQPQSDLMHFIGSGVGTPLWWQIPVGEQHGTSGCPWERAGRFILLAELTGRGRDPWKQPRLYKLRCVCSHIHISRRYIQRQASKSQQQQKPNHTLKFKHHLCTHIILSGYYNQMESSCPFLGARMKMSLQSSIYLEDRSQGARSEWTGLKNTINT